MEIGQFKSHFCIWSKVTSKKTGFPTIGTICGIVNAYVFYIDIITRTKGQCNLNTWTELYPDWNKPDRLVYGVFVEKPQRPLTFEEYCNGIANNFPEFKTMEKYLQMIPEAILIYYPEDDLELFE